MSEKKTYVTCSGAPKLGGVSIVGVDAADFRHCKDDGVGPILFQPDFDRDLITKVDHRAIGFQYFVASRLEMSRDGRADHSFVTGDPNSADHF